jgi:hypothetical protein
MDHGRLKELAVTLLREAKLLAASDDASASAIRVTDPILDSGSPRAQSFGDDRAGDSDYKLWIQLLQLHCAAQKFIDHGESARASLQEQIVQFDKLLRVGANPKDGDMSRSKNPAVGLDEKRAVWQ